MIIKCAIVDDEPLAVELLASYVKKIPFLELCGKYSNATDALHGIGEEPVDLLFLDIQMPELNGLELSKMVPENTRIVFTTAFNQYAVDGFRVNALDYLLKPIAYEDFLHASNKALQRLEAQQKADAVAAPQDRFIYVKSEYKLVRIFLDDITYIEGLKDYVQIHLDTPQKKVLCLMNMKTLEDYLPSPEFLRVHRSFIVHMPKADIIDRLRIVFGDNYIPISESYKDTVQQYINERTLT
jgi:DNA-binding LytR/AlgR family response regulator